MRTLEQKIIEDSEKFLAIASQNEAYSSFVSEYEILLTSYKKLSRQVVKLTNISDRQQAKFVKLNEELDIKNKFLEDKEFLLEKMVNKKTAQLEETTNVLVSSLESANLYNDEDTGNHNKRIAFYSETIAKSYAKIELEEKDDSNIKCTSQFIKQVKLWAPLHDVGKVAIRDSILKKPGKLTFEEFEEMKTHATIGHKMLDYPAVDDIAKNIVRYHHEKWNGKGYADGLKGEDIPLEARIVSLADVYDALTQKRVYKEAFSEEYSREIILEESGVSFDPKVIEAYIKCQDEIYHIRKTKSTYTT